MNLLLLIVFAFSALSLAIAPSIDHNEPYGLEMRAGHPRRHRHDHDVQPDFRQPCICGPDNCPLFLNKRAVSEYLGINVSLSDIDLQMCQCNGAAAQACYLKSERGCPVPSPQVSCVLIPTDKGMSLKPAKTFVRFAELTLEFGCCTLNNYARAQR